MVWYKKVDSFLSIDRKRRYLVAKPSNANFSCRTLNGSYPVSVMFSHCLIGGCHGGAFFISVCYCFSPWGGGRHFGGVFVGRVRDPSSPHPRATPRSGGVSPTGPGPPPWGTPEWVGFPAAASTGHGRSCFGAAYSRTPGASPPAPAGPSAPPP